MNGLSFLAYVEQILAPTLRRGDISGAYDSQKPKPFSSNEGIPKSAVPISSNWFTVSVFPATAPLPCISDL